MNFPTDLVYLVDSREVWGQTEWTLSFWFQDSHGGSCVVHTWENEPTQAQIDEQTTFALRVIDVYCRNIKYQLPKVSITKWE